MSGIRDLELIRELGSYGRQKIGEDGEVNSPLQGTRSPCPPAAGRLASRALGARLFVDVADAMRIVGDGGELRDGARPRGGLRLEADADGKFGVEAEGAKDLPILCVR